MFMNYGNRCAALLALALVMLLCGCAGSIHPQPKAGGGVYTAIVDTRACYYESKLSEAKKSTDADTVEKIILPQVVGSVATVLAKGLVDKGFDMMALALRKAAGLDAVADVTVKTGGMQYAQVIRPAGGEPDVLRGTLAIAHGLFDGTGETDESDIVKEARAKLESSNETFMLICGMEYTADVTAMRLVPKYLLFNGGVAGKKKISLIVHFTFRLPARPGDDAKSGAFAATSLVFNNLRAATTLNDIALRSKATEWVPLPEVKLAKEEGSLKVIPFVAEIQIVETKTPNKLLTLMAEAFESKKDDLKETVNATINIGTKE